MGSIEGLLAGVTGKTAGAKAGPSSGAALPGLCGEEEEENKAD